MKKQAIVLFLLAVSCVCSSITPAAFLVGYGHGDDRTFEFPPPTGPFAVGRVLYHWVDPARDEPMTAAPNDQREIAVYLWYPAQTTGNELRAPYFPWPDLLKKEIKWPVNNALRMMQTRAIADAPFASSATNCPIVLLLHGNEMNCAQYSFFAEELASHGYIVCGIDSPGEARGVEISGARTLGYHETKWASFQKVVIDPQVPLEQQAYPKFYRERVAVRAKDASFVLNQLERLNSMKEENRWVGRMDLKRVGIFGHSHGGVAAASAALTDTRFQACLNLDGRTESGPYVPAADGSGPAQPFMLLTKSAPEPSEEELKKMGRTREQWQQRREEMLAKTYGQLKSVSYQLIINGAKHNSFSDDATMVAALTKAKDYEAQVRYAQIVRAYTLAFFNQHVQGKSAALLSGPSQDFPEVAFRRWK